MQRGLKIGTEGCRGVELHSRDVERCTGLTGGGTQGDLDGGVEGYILSCYTHWLIVSQLKKIYHFLSLVTISYP